MVVVCRADRGEAWAGNMDIRQGLEALPADGPQRSGGQVHLLQLGVGPCAKVACVQGRTPQVHLQE
jgi:hypothetical protein